MSEPEQSTTETGPDDANNKHTPPRSPESVQNILTPAGTSKPGRALPVLAIIVASASLGISGYFGWQLQTLKQQSLQSEQNQSVFNVDIEQLQSQMARQQARLTDTIANTQPLQAQIETFTEREQRLVSRLDSTAVRLKDLEGNSRDQWRLAEVEYLMRLANQRLLMGTDSASARNLLQSADNILNELDDYSLFPIREALAEDLAMVRAVPSFDQETLYLRLQALNSLIPQLQLLDDQRLKVTSDPVTVSTGFTPEATGWVAKAGMMFQETWQQFTRLFRINSQRSNEIQPLLTAEQEQLIRQNLRLMVEQAKLAVLNRQPEIYRSSLKQARAWTVEYFALGGEIRNTLLSELDTLLAFTIVTELPDINRSLEALRSYQSRLEAQPAADSPPAPVSEPPVNKPESQPPTEQEPGDTDSTEPQTREELLS